MDIIKRELECSVACCVLLDNKNIDNVLIKSEDIEHPPARAVIQCCREIGKVDFLLARNWAKGNGVELMLSDFTVLLNFCPTSANLDLYVKQLRELNYKQGIKAICDETIRMSQEGKDPEAIASMVSTRRAMLDSAYQINQQDGDILSTVEDFIGSIERRDHAEELVPTGFNELDNLHGGGFLPNEYVILSARPSCGKTALALQIAIDSGVRVCLFSLEMNKRQVAVRLMANISGRNTKLASRDPSKLSDFDRDIMLSSSELLKKVSMRISVYDEPNQTVASIRSISKKEVERGARLIIIDYLQLITSIDKTESREREVSNISRSLKNLSKELDVPLIVLAQLNRSCEAENRVPRLSDLRESGSIEQDANSVVFLHDTGTKNDASYKIITMIVAKGRDVGTGAVKLVFNSDRQRFYGVNNG